MQNVRKSTIALTMEVFWKQMCAEEAEGRDERRTIFTTLTSITGFTIALNIETLFLTGASVLTQQLIASDAPSIQTRGDRCFAVETCETILALAQGSTLPIRRAETSISARTERSFHVLMRDFRWRRDRTDMSESEVTLKITYTDCWWAEPMCDFERMNPQGLLYCIEVERFDQGKNKQTHWPNRNRFHRPNYNSINFERRISHQIDPHLPRIRRTFIDI